MEDLYKTPSESCGDLERRSFWASVIADQSTSGMSMVKFCHMHRLKFTTFRDYKYRKLNTETTSRNINDDNSLKYIQNDKDVPRFIPLQVATSVSANKCQKNEAVAAEVAEIKIVFKNGHKLILPSTETHLLSIIKIVGELRC